jgi:hypothetical protein
VPIVVHHYFPLGSTNVGDLLVARAIRGAVGLHFGACEFVDFPVNDRYGGDDRPIGLRGENLERSNVEADLVIVGGSNLLEPRKPRNGRGGWGVITDVESVTRLTPPLLLIGMGTGSSFAKRIRPYYPPAVDEFRLLHEKALAVAVRDVTTVQKLAEIGVSCPCVGCPVTFLTDDPVTPAPRDLPLMVSFPPPRIVERFGGKQFMQAAMKYVAWLRGRGEKIVVTLHDTTDLEPAKQWVPPGVEIFHTENLDELIARFQSSRGVIGFRLHAALLGLGLGKPVIPVGLDWRGLAFIETFEAHSISIRAHRLGQFAKLRALTERLLHDDPVLIDYLAGKKSLYLERYHDFLSRAAGHFRSLGRILSEPAATRC